MDKSEESLKIETTSQSLDNGNIQISQNIFGNVQKFIVETKDKHVRKQLKSLGWIAPEDVKALKEEVDDIPCSGRTFHSINFKKEVLSLITNLGNNE